MSSRFVSTVLHLTPGPSSSAIKGFRTLPSVLMSLLLLSISPYGVAEETVNTKNAKEETAETTQTNVTLPPSRTEYRASYKKGVPIRGRAVRILKPLSENKYEYIFDVESFIVDIKEKLNLSIEDGHIIPHRYNYERSGWVKGKEKDVRFNWEKLQATGEGHKEFEIDIPRLALDKLGYQLQLRMDLAAGKNEMVYQVVDGKRIREFKFAIVGEEKLKTDLGEIPCVVVEKIRDPDSARETRLWFAKDWHYVLVQMIQVEPDGERYEIFLDSASIGGESLSLNTQGR